MGVFDFVKHGTEEMRLSRPSGSREPVFVHPDAQLPLWGQLVVEPDEAAVFVNAGRALGIVGPGRHAVHPSKLPFLEGLADANGRLALQLVFVRLSPIERAKVTGRLDPVADPGSLSAVSPLIDGDLTVQVVDPIAFVEDHLAGGASKPILARAGIVATIDGVRLAIEGRRVVVFGGDRLPRRAERPTARISTGGGPMACRGCGEIGEEGSFCAACGKLVTDREQCVACRADLPASARFCEACGVRVAS